MAQVTTDPTTKLDTILKQQGKMLELLERVVEQQQEIIEKLSNLDLPGTDYELVFDPEFEDEE